MRKSCLFGLFAFFVIAVNCSAATLSSQTMFSPHGDEIPLIPFLDYCIDETMTWDIEDAASTNRANSYKPLVMDKLPLTEGIVWLRFILSPSAAGAKPSTYLLDIGPGTPGVPILYTPQRNELSGSMEWKENTPGQRDILLLPEQGAESLVCYIRLDGLPDIWFAPTIRSPQNAAGNWGSLSRTGAILALAVVMLLCLLRGISENGQWRFWIALFVGLSLTQAILGMPRIQDAFNILNLFAVLTPGLALMILPHAGRHLMRTREVSRSIDIQLIILSLPGAALALLPLIPHWDWLYRWLDLWPLGLIIFIPTAIGAWIMGLTGSRRFLAACIIPPIFVAFAIFGLDFGLPANLLSSAPLWGIAISALLLTATKSPVSAEPANKKSGQKIISPPMDNVEPIINLNHPLDDPNLRIVLPNEDTSKERSPANKTEPESTGDTSLERKELALREPLEEVLRETAALSNCSLPPAARQFAEKIILAGQRMANIISREDLIADQQNYQYSDENFNLQRVLRNAHDIAAPFAEHAALSLSWYIPPHLDQQFRGDAKALEDVLTLLLESSIRGTAHGSIHLSARRVPDSADPGHILFTITDTGAGVPPHQRSSLALIRAWELAGRYNGYLGMESNPHGLTISFSMHFSPVAENAEELAHIPHIILASDNPDELETMANILKTMPARVSNAANSNEILVRQRMDASPLLIACGKFALPSAGDMVREFASLAKIAGFVSCHILAITKDDSQWPLLKPSGFTHAMIEPVDEETLLETARNLIETAEKNRADNSPEKNNSSLIDLVDAFYSHTVQFEEIPQKIAASPNVSQSPSENESLIFEGPDWLKTDGIQDDASLTPDGQNEKIDADIDSADAKGNLEEPDLIADERKSNDMDLQASPVQDQTYQTLSEEKKKINLYDENHDDERDVDDKETQPEVIDFNGDATSRDLQDDFSSVDNEGQFSDIKTAPAAPDARVKIGQDPIITALVDRLEEAMNQAQAAYKEQNTAQVAEAIGRLARQAESFGGLRQLTRMAQTVERAAKASDLSAIKDLLPELANAVERNRIALTQ